MGEGTPIREATWPPSRGVFLLASVLTAGPTLLVTLWFFLPSRLAIFPHWVLLGVKGVLMKKLGVLFAVFFSGLAVAQGLPRFGTAKFGEAAFGVAEPAVAVPFMPLWATITLAVALWVVAYLMRTKES